MVEITLEHGSKAETQTRKALVSLLENYDLKPWIFTFEIHLDETAIPHSHPILTLNTLYRHNETLLLATFLHEQLHWFEEMHACNRDLAVEETKKHYVEVPCNPPEGASDEQSTRLHLLVCYLEFQVLKCVVGIQEARKIIYTLSQSHYCWVYRTVLADEEKIGIVVRKYDLLPVNLCDR